IDVSSLNAKISDYDNSIQSYSDLCDSVVKSNEDLDSKVDYVLDRLITLQIQQNDIQEMQNKTTEKIIDMQCRSMRENLIFTGISESDLNRGESENTEAILKDFLRTEMNIDRDISFDRVHRLGYYDPNQIYSRPIVAKFERFKDKEFVRMSAPAPLRGKRFGVNEQYPIEVENKRKLLYPEAKKYRRNKLNKVRLVRDKLYVNGEEIIVEESERYTINKDRNASRDDRNQAVNNRQSNRTQNIRWNSQRSRGQPKLQSRDHIEGQNRERGSGYIHGRGRGVWSRRITARRNDETGSPIRYSIGGTNSAIPINNKFQALSCTNDDTPKPKAAGKHQASSPLDADVSLKKVKDSTKSSATETGQTCSSESFGNGSNSGVVADSIESMEAEPTPSFGTDDSSLSLATERNPVSVRMPEAVTDSELLYYGPERPLTLPTESAQVENASTSIGHDGSDHRNID
ncbi:MAG: hypothetical protein AB2541_13945, partial [Candidatus Thiodiazotropha sp.]